MFVSVVKFGGVLQLKVQNSGKQVANDMSFKLDHAEPTQIFRQHNIIEIHKTFRLQ